MDRYKYLFKCEMFFPSIWDDDKFILLANEEIADLFALPLRTEFESFQSAYQYIRTTKFAEMLKSLEDNFLVWNIQRIKCDETIMECAVTKAGIVEKCEIAESFKHYAVNERQKELCLLDDKTREEKTIETTIKTGNIFRDEDENCYVYVTPIDKGNKHIVIARNQNNSKIDCEMVIKNDVFLSFSMIDVTLDTDLQKSSEVLQICPESYLIWRIENAISRRKVDKEGFDRVAYYINLSKKYIDEKIEKKEQ